MTKLRKKIDFNTGLESISHLASQQSNKLSPSALKSNLYFTGDVKSSHVKRLFPMHSRDRFLEDICKPTPKDLEGLESYRAYNDALAALDWCRELADDIAPHIKADAERVIAITVEHQIRLQHQRNLLISA